MAYMPNKYTGVDLTNKYVNLVKDKNFATTSANFVANTPVNRFNAVVENKVGSSVGTKNFGVSYDATRAATMYPRTTAGNALTTTGKPIATMLRSRSTRVLPTVERGDTRKTLLSPIVIPNNKYYNTLSSNATAPVKASAHFAKDYTIDIPIAQKPCTAYAKTFSIDKRGDQKTSPSLSRNYSHNMPENPRATATYTRIYYNNEKREPDNPPATYYRNPEKPEINKASAPVAYTYDYIQPNATSFKTVKPVSDKPESVEAKTATSIKASSNDKRDKTTPIRKTYSKAKPPAPASREIARSMTHNPTFAKTLTTVKEVPSKIKNNNFKSDTIDRSKSLQDRKPLASARKFNVSEKTTIASTTKKTPKIQNVNVNARKTGGYTGAIPKTVPNPQTKTLPVIVPNIKKEKIEKLPVDYKGFTVDNTDSDATPRAIPDNKPEDKGTINAVNRNSPVVKSHALFRPSVFNEKRLLQKMQTFNAYGRGNDTLTPKPVKEKPTVAEPSGTLKAKIPKKPYYGNPADKFKNEKDKCKRLSKIHEEPIETLKCGTKPPPRILAPEEGMTSCKFCNRNFVDDRIERHENICQQLAVRKVQVYDSSKQRLKAVVESNNCENVVSTKDIKKPNYNWRRKHNDFLSCVRQAKAVSVQLAQGKSLSEIPQPPPSENPDYIQCPHCLRRFNEPAAIRHIPKCEHMTHNKKPKVRNVRK